MKNGKIVKFLLILLTLTLTITPVMAQDEVVKSGPWADELFFKIYLNPEAEYLALKTGDINIMDWELPAEKVADALADPNILTDSTADLGYYLIDINCQRWPTSNVYFRRALAHLVDKPRIETDVLQGFGYALDSQYYGIDDFADYVRKGLAALTLDDVNRVLRENLDMDNMQYVFISRDAQDLRERLLSDQQSPMTYAADLPQEVLDEDKLIDNIAIGFDSVEVVSADDVFN